MEKIYLNDAHTSEGWGGGGVDFFSCGQGGSTRITATVTSPFVFEKLNSSSSNIKMEDMGFYVVFNETETWNR